MENPYQAPAADVVQAVEPSEAAPYYEVGITKFIVMAIGTFNLYLVYWFYRHWNAQRPYMDKRILPAMRGLFSIFFTVSLFRRISEDLQRRGLEQNWQSGGLAASYIILTLASNLLDSLSRRSEDFNAADAVGWLLVIVIPLLLVPVQRRANRVCGDADGDGNASLNWANWLWLLPFAALWLVIGFGVLVTLFPAQFE